MKRYVVMMFNPGSSWGGIEDSLGEFDSGEEIMRTIDALVVSTDGKHSWVDGLTSQEHNFLNCERFQVVDTSLPLEQANIHECHWEPSDVGKMENLYGFLNTLKP